MPGSSHRQVTARAVRTGKGRRHGRLFSSPASEGVRLQSRRGTRRPAGAAGGASGRRSVVITERSVHWLCGVLKDKTAFSSLPPFGSD